MGQFNYHHLRYFRDVAVEGNLSRAAQRLNVSQSALSMQIKTFEDRIGHRLFDRVGRSLVLTEEGRIALDYADRIFSAGDELISTLNQTSLTTRPLRVGALSTLSRNFQLQFLRPLMMQGPFNVILRSGNTDGLMDDLRVQSLDVVLTTEVPRSDPQTPIAAQKIAEQKVGLHGRPNLLIGATLSELLTQAPLILPTESVIRAAFESLINQLGVGANIVANVDDMAMVRLLARDGFGVAVAPSVVLADEIEAGTIATAPFELGIVEPFYAVTLPRKFPHPALANLLGGAN